METNNPKVKRGQIVVITGCALGNYIGSICKVLAITPKTGSLFSDKKPGITYNILGEGAISKNAIFAEVSTNKKDHKKYYQSKTYLNKPFWYEDTYRVATEEEKKAYRKGIRHISNMPKK